jgi:aerobic-type carbon monoxide dehydrogenase small subunit (CoxS/CutS family)
VSTLSVSLTVNGVAVGPRDVPAELLMIDFLREYLGLTGTKFGCGIGACSACVVIVDHPGGDSETMQTCTNPASNFSGMSIRTVEGIAKDGALSAVQRAFLDNFAFQCGYCTAGFVNAAEVLVENLARAPVRRTEIEARILGALDPHICRCTGYVRYYAALRDLILADRRLTI